MQKFIVNVVVGLLGNESPHSNRFTLIYPKSENDVRLWATLGSENPTGKPVGVVSAEDGTPINLGDRVYIKLKNGNEYIANIHKIEPDGIVLIFDRDWNEVLKRWIKCNVANIDFKTIKNEDVELIRIADENEHF